MLKKFNPSPEPLPSRQQVADLFKKGHFHSAERARKKIGQRIVSFQAEFEAGVRQLVLSHQAHQVLSFLYAHPGVACHLDVPTLLLATFQSGNFSGFLKEAERFRAYVGLESEIKAAIDHLVSKGQIPQAEAYKRKFAALKMSS